MDQGNEGMQNHVNYKIYFSNFDRDQNFIFVHKALANTNFFAIEM